MNLDFGSEYDDFRDKVAGFCSSHKGVHLTGSLYGQYETIKRARSVSPNGETMSLIEWQQLLIENGYFARNIPKEYGGYGGELDIVKNVIINSEFNKAGIPSGTGGQGIDFLVPTLLEMGTEDQKKQYIKSALHLETIWCQGYSEPGSGSDLASLKLKATSDGDDLILNGSKIWTSHAHYANRMFLLVRTNDSGKPQDGITFLLLDMDSPGIKVEPILFASGTHEVNQVFFENVRVAKSNIVGEEHKGWTVAKYLLEFERGGGGTASRERTGWRPGPAHAGRSAVRARPESRRAMPQDCGTATAPSVACMRRGVRLC